MASEFVDTVKYILDGLKSNSITKDEALRSLAVGALIGGTAGAGIGAITKRKKRNILLGLLLGGATGAVSGPAFAQYRKYMAGIPFDNSDIDINSLKKGDKLTIGVAGAANGEGESWFADEMRRRFPGKNYMLRHVDSDKLEKLYDVLKEKGVDVAVVGHSNGGKPAAEFIKRHPEVQGYLIDPVSWFGRGVPENAIAFTSDKATRHGGPFENTIADLGGRWNDASEKSVTYLGSHSNRIRDILNTFVANRVRPGDDITAPSWVTGLYGKKVEKQGAATENPMLLPQKVKVQSDHDRLSPPMSRDEAKRYGELLSRQTGDVSWRSLFPDVPQAKGLLEGIGAVQDGISGYFRPFRLSDEAARYTMPNDPYYHNILMAGANAGGEGLLGLSAMPFGIASKGSNELFRNGQVKELRAAIEAAINAGKHPRVIGHSWGGADVARIAHEYPNVPFISIDPVSWTGRPDILPDNLTVLHPRNANNPFTSDETVWGYLAGKLGGRWPEIKGGHHIYYKGGHVAGAGKALNYIIGKEWIRRISQEEGGKYDPAKYGIPWNTFRDKVYYQIYPNKKVKTVRNDQLTKASSASKWQAYAALVDGPSIEPIVSASK